MNARAECGQPLSSAFVDEPLTSAIECDTASVDELERFAFFQNWHSDIIDVGLMEGDTASFEAKEKVWQIDDIAFAAIDASPHHLLHWEHKRKPIVDHWIVTVRSADPSGFDDRAPTHRLRMANLAVPGLCESRGRLIALFFPHSAIDAPLFPEISDTAADFFAEYLVLLHQNLVHLKRSSIGGIAKATSHMLAAVLQPSDEKVAQAQAPIDAVVMTRAIRAIEAQISNPDLCPSHICKTIGVSRSRLYRIFEPADGISNFIRRKRLLETYRSLADTTNVDSISQIAANVGFTDPSSYSRMFKREFGRSPKEVRNLSWQGVRHPLRMNPHQCNFDTPTLNTLLINNALGLPNASV